MIELDKIYDPKKYERDIYKLWEGSGYFNPDNLPSAGSRQQEAGSSSHKTPTAFCVMMAPPNITGSLHMGHALEHTMTDILVRWRRMQGFKTLWLPGIDHAGIAAQNVVEKELRKEGLTRHDLGREKFVEKVWQWKGKYGHIILDQLRKLGVSADWSRTRFTLDEEYVEAVRTAFNHYKEKGWIYRALRTINWCVRCQTSISDLEVEYVEEDTKLYYIQYGPFVLATVRPETKFGDTALAVHPNDERYKKYIGQEIEIESLDTAGTLDQPGKKTIKIKVLADEAVDPKFGTGVIKVTPAHDIADYDISQRHHLPLKQVIDDKGRMMATAGKYADLKIKEAREKIVSDLWAVGLLIKEEPYHHNLAVCSRCNTAIEPLPSQQWFLKMKESAQLAREAIQSGEVTITPKNFSDNALVWLDNIRDWCISRQIWWGHQLPVWIHEARCVPIAGREPEVSQCQEIKVSTIEPKCEHCDAKYIQSEDVLDTWFSAALWPFATLGWPNVQKSDVRGQMSDLERFYPTQFITCAREILNLWILRMIFSGKEFMSKAPFATALIHGTILNKDGRRMSKSLGTGVDPLSLIEKYGADATRFGVIWQAMGTQDIRWDEAAVAAGKKFANKIWNAGRFVLEQVTTSDVLIFRTSDVLILKQLAEAKKSVEKHLENYEFGHALHIAYDFFWHDFCDVYIEESKNNPSDETKRILSHVLVESLKLLHPFVPFVTETIYQKLSNKGGLLMVQKW